MKHWFTTVALLAGTALACPAWATDASKISSNFVEKVATSDRFEIESSQLALAQSGNPKIKAFARQMIEDHAQSTSDLKSALGDSEVDPALTDQPFDAKQRRLMSNLKAAKGRKFDESYLAAQKDAHKQAIELFGTYAKKGDEVALKDFAIHALPVIKRHKDHVHMLKVSQ